MLFQATAVLAAMLASNAPYLPSGTLAPIEVLTLRLSLPHRHQLARATTFHLSPPKRQTLWTRPKKVSLSIRAAPNLDVGFREFGKNWGGGLWLVSEGGVKLGAAYYLAKVGIGMPMDHRLMLVLQAPLW